MIHSLPMSNSFASLPQQFYSRVQPTPFVSQAHLIHFNSEAAALLDLDPDAQFDVQFVEVFSGKQKLAGAAPLAMLYAGHQFGHYVSQLGDGRAILLGETTNQRGEQWEIQLKGSGLTPYSRDGDGRAVLRSSIREYLCSEAMHGLGIATTRALCLIGSDDEVYREQIETGAMLTRLAPSHVRFGSFEVFFYRKQHQRVRQLADYVIDGHYPELAQQTDRYTALLQSVSDRTAKLMAQWQAVGFAHGVMNTDNMSILGLTLDYGPYGFMEAYDAGYICNHTDHQGRYAFDQQPQIGLWNLTCLAQALTPLIDIDAAKAVLESYQSVFSQHYYSLMLQKLGIETVEDASVALLGELLALMQHSGSDYTRVFRSLCGVVSGDGAKLHHTRDLFLQREPFDRWLQDYRAYLSTQKSDDAEREEKMKRVNPKYVLRNYMAQIAIEKAEQQDYTEIENLMNLLRTPFDEHPQWQHYAEASPEWAGDIQVSCSS